MMTTSAPCCSAPQPRRSASWGSVHAAEPVARADRCSGTLDTCSHAIPAMQEEEAALIAGLVFESG
jgi:hypothetical protein